VRPRLRFSRAVWRRPDRWVCCPKVRNISQGLRVKAASRDGHVHWLKILAIKDLANRGERLGLESQSYEPSHALNAMELRYKVIAQGDQAVVASHDSGGRLGRDRRTDIVLR
jgi:hypothetical protein